jgi:uncharacterized protein (DUF1800 family)
MTRFRAPLAVLLCFGLSLPATPYSFAAAPPSNDRDSAGNASSRSGGEGKLRGDERILHALNRFAFGPKPGDLEAVRAMGLEKWFERQLHPETLDLSGLDARLAQFPALQQSPQDLLYNLPSNAVIRQAADGKASIPESGVLHAIYANQIGRVQLRRQEKDLKEQPSGSATGSMIPNASSGATMQAVAGAPTAPAGMASAPATSSAQTGQMGMIPTTEQLEKPEFAAALDEAQVERIAALAPEERIARLARMKQPEFDAFRKALKPAQRAALAAGLDPRQRETLGALENPQRQVVEELTAQRLVRDIYSEAQLQEVMTDFWLNHFNVYLNKNEETPYYLVSFERDTVRPRALGKFEDLLAATAHSPAMLLYLDNASSMGPDSPAAERVKAREARNPGGKPKAREGLNENYARELMELHTLGVNGGYSQADVTEVARVLTGWTVDRPQRGGGFKFDESRHEPGAKTVLGKKIEGNGEEEGSKLLHLLATRPATAQFLCRKLAVRFVSDDPPKKLVDRMAKSFRSSDGDTATVLRTLFRSPEFWAADNWRAKVKTPLEYAVSAARAGNATFENMQPIANALRDMGMPLYGAVPPTGYNWKSSAWVGTGALVNRMNFALSFAANRLPGVKLDWNPRQTGASETAPSLVPSAEAEEQRLESLLIAGGLSSSTRTAVLQQFQAQSASGPASAKTASVSAKIQTPAQAASALERQDQLLAGLLLGSPEFQRR